MRSCVCLRLLICQVGVLLDHFGGVVGDFSDLPEGLDLNLVGVVEIGQQVEQLPEEQVGLVGFALVVLEFDFDAHVCVV